MLNSIRFVASKGARGASAAVIVLCALLAGCAGGVSNTAQYSAQPQVRPDNIYVYSFDSTPNQVKLDNGGVIQKMTSQFDGTSTAQKQAQEAAEVREQVANPLGCAGTGGSKRVARTRQVRHHRFGQPSPPDFDWARCGQERTQHVGSVAV
jgi:type IV secretory pathway TrbL component